MRPATHGVAETRQPVATAINGRIVHHGVAPCATLVSHSVCARIEDGRAGAVDGRRKGAQMMVKALAPALFVFAASFVFAVTWSQDAET